MDGGTPPDMRRRAAQLCAMAVAVHEDLHQRLFERKDAPRKEVRLHGAAEIGFLNSRDPIVFLPAGFPIQSRDAVE